MIKSYLKSYGILFALILILTILLTIITYFINIPSNIFKALIPVISILTSSIILGKQIKEKAYLEGIKFSLVYLALVTIFKLILKTPFNLKVIILYIIIILTSIIGSMIGINIKRK